MSGKPSFTQRWQSMTPKKRMALVFGGGAGVILIIANALAPSQPLPQAAKKDKAVSSTTLAMPGTNGDMAVEKLSASIDALVREDKQNKQEIQQLRQVTNANGGANNPQVDAATVAELSKLRQKVEQLEADQHKEPSLDDALPNVSGSDYSGYAPQQSAEPVRETPSFRVTGNSKDEESDDEERQAPKPVVFIPAGSNFEGVLLNGMDAPTSGVAQKNPVPAMLRIKTDAILPNRYRYDVSECFIIVSGFGVLSTERAQLQTVTLSCMKNNGEVIESKMEGYVVGEDGKVGLRGRLVTRQGALLAKTFVAGFASGLGTAMTPMPVQSLNTTPGSTAQYQTPNFNQVMTSGAAQGISQSARSLSQFYLNMANEMFPVIEVDANRRVTVVLLKGIELKLTGEKQL